MAVYIVAECGVNWRNMNEAKRMIEVFKEVGANACKFQMYQADDVEMHPRSKELKDIVISPEMAAELFKYGRQCGIEVFFTPMYREAVDALEKIGVNKYKIRSRDATNSSLVKKVLETGKETYISVASDRIDWDSLSSHPLPGLPEARYTVKLLYCIERYPAPDNEVHLSGAFPSYRTYQSSIEYFGISDHTVGITCPIAAVSMGARLVEKHVKLNNDFKWIDDVVAINPVEFKEMVYHIRRTEVMRR